MDIYDEQNRPVALQIRDGYIWVTVKDGRIVAAPLHWFDWLEQATVEQQANFRLGSFSIVWPELEDGIDMEALLLGVLQSGD
ncbi:MAG: DUF2442 domain-containing protein [bacterium]|nr:DUF2442 domain-containing protein [bacterium]